MHWSDRIGRRLKQRDVHVFMAVAEQGSMAKAADHLAVSRPVVSKAIAGLEVTLGVRLLDRAPEGIRLTAYGEALLRRGAAMFDELRQGVEEIAFLSDPGKGSLRVGCTEVAAAGVVANALGRMAVRYPSATFHVAQGSVETSIQLLRERRCDLVISRVPRPEPDIDMEPLLHERLIVVCGIGAKWATRRRLTLADLVDGPWIQSPAEIVPGGPTYEAFSALNLPVPVVQIVSNSLNLRFGLLEAGRFLTMIPESALRLSARRAQVKVLPVEVPLWRLPTVVATLKGRTLTPLAEQFIEQARQVAMHLAAASGPPVATVT